MRREPGPNPYVFPSDPHIDRDGPGGPDARGHQSRIAGRREGRIAGQPRHRGGQPAPRQALPYGAAPGPTAFDCSGLVYRAFRQANLARKIGGFNTAHGYFYSFRKKGKTSRSNPRPGDIVVWNNGGHVGIYVGHGQAVSALLSGVKRHKVGGLNIKFTTYIHLGLSSSSSSVASRSKPKVYRTTTPAIADAGQGGPLVPPGALGVQGQAAPGHQDPRPGQQGCLGQGSPRP